VQTVRVPERAADRDIPIQERAEQVGRRPPRELQLNPHPALSGVVDHAARPVAGKQDVHRVGV
jgi:hypothetical protein